MILKRRKQIPHLAALFAATLLLASCVGTPTGVKPVDQFEVTRYLGQWYEIARLDHSFERGLDQVTANYSLREDGGLRVVNRGYSAEKGRWKEAEGKAYVVEDEATGHLKVSFFGPFYGSYVIFDLDKEDYQYAFVSGPNHSYLWLLSRTPVVSDDLIARFREQAEALGFDLDKLVMVDHSAETQDQVAP